MKRTALLSAMLLAAAVSFATADSVAPAPQPIVAAQGGIQLRQAALDAIDQDAAKSTAAIKLLRDSGPAGLDALFAAHAPAIAKALTVERIADATGKLSPVPPTPEQLRLRNAIDSVAMQRDASASHLYWYTDLESAKAAALASGKPILSLRMLGKLNEDLSCANSRFFRTTLYSNAEVSKFLRENYILHWESVRPVPVITIDMGDGREIIRTITGNSIHYILDAQGRVVDALPGLYGAHKLLKYVTSDAPIAKSTERADDVHYRQILTPSWNGRITEINIAWKNDLQAIGVAISTNIPPAANPGTGVPKGTTTTDFGQPVGPGAPPSAARAGIVAQTKTRLERIMIAEINPDGNALNQATTDGLWIKIAARHAGDAALDDSAKQLVQLKLKMPAEAANEIAIPKMTIESPLLRMIRNLQTSIALDTVKNDYQLHTKILEWLAASNKPVALAGFNERVYAELFLTPSSDAWLGLVPADTFSALDNDGLCTPQSTASR